MIDITVSVVIVSFNTREILRECLTTLIETAGKLSYETIVVDNASQDGSADMVAEAFPQVQLIRSEVNLGFAAANNRGFAVAQGHYIVMLNSDAFLQGDALVRSVHHMEANPCIGLAGARLVGRDGSWQPSARQFPSLLNHILTVTGLAAKYPQSRFFGRFDRTWADPNESAEVDWVPGAYTIMRHNVLKRVNYFDEAFFLYFEEVDLCRRIQQAEYEVHYFADVVVVHLGGESSKTLNKTLSSTGKQIALWQMRSALLFYRKHYGSVMVHLWWQFEYRWHQLRAWKNRHSDAEKVAYSQHWCELLQQAWEDTQGGRVSPPRPW